MKNLHKGSLIFTFIAFMSCLSSCTSYPTVGIEESELEPRRIESNFNIVRSIEFSSDGGLMLVTGEAYEPESSSLGKVEIWDTNEWKLIQTLETEKAYNLDAYFVSENNEEIIVINAFGEVSLWNTKNGIRDKILVEGIEGDNVAMPVDFSIFQRLLSLPSLEGLLLLNINTGEKHEIFWPNNDYWWQSITFSEKGTYLALLTSPQDDTLPSVVHIFDTETHEQISSIEIASHPVIDVSFVSDRHFVLAGVDGFLEVRDFKTGEIVENLSIETPLHYNSLASTRINSMPESNFFAVGSAIANGTYSVIGEITLWNADSAEPLCSTGKMSDAAFVNPAIAVSPNGQHLAGVVGGDVIVWDIEPCF